MPKRSFLGGSVLIIAIFLITAAILHALGRIPWCTCGIGLWTGNAWGSDTSQHLFDPYTTSHILHGIIFAWALQYLAPKLPVRHRLLIALLLEVGWEILENSPIIINRYRESTAALDYVGDSILNSWGDILAALGGFWLAQRFSWKWILAGSVATELLMLLLYRDNLTLNVLMLLLPLESVKEWQMLR